MSRAPTPVVVVHGGAGDVEPERRPRHVEGCRDAAAAGLEILLAGGTALDAVVAAVVRLEDDPSYNAGRGACLTDEGGIELDASLMVGADLRAGAVAALPPFDHPILVARALMERDRHLMYAGPAAADVARELGFEPVPLERLRTSRAVARLEAFRAGRAPAGWAGGTVGAVACDAQGRTAAATSTGGTVGKRPGRVGDSPILGAGTWADDETGACSATGIGEAIMRAGLARSACELLRAGRAPREAADEAIATFGRRLGGSGGIILVDTAGRVGVAWNTETMSHAVATPGEPVMGGPVESTAPDRI